MNNSHGHVLVLHLQFHEGVRTFREVASVRHIMRSISVSCSRQRFKAGMVDLRVGRKAGGTGAPDLAMSLLAGPLVNNLMTSTWSSAMDQWWQLLICLGFQKEYQHGGVLLEDVGRCWKMLEERSIMYRLDQCDLRAPVWPFPLKPKSKVLDGFVWKARAENCRITLTTSLL